MDMVSSSSGSGSGSSTTSSSTTSRTDSSAAQSGEVAQMASVLAAVVHTSEQMNPRFSSTCGEVDDHQQLQDAQDAAIAEVTSSGSLAGSARRTLNATSAENHRQPRGTAPKRRPFARSCATPPALSAASTLIPRPKAAILTTRMLQGEEPEALVSIGSKETQRQPAAQMSVPLRRSEDCTGLASAIQLRQCYALTFPLPVPPPLLCVCRCALCPDRKFVRAICHHPRAFLAVRTRDALNEGVSKCYQQRCSPYKTYPRMPA